jgi:hypothetical protein
MTVKPQVARKIMTFRRPFPQTDKPIRVAVALSVGSNRSRRAGRSEVFWAVDRADRYRMCAELVQLAGHVVVVCRSQADASRVAGELSRHGVPTASVEHRDFDAPHIRAQVVTDETALSCARNGARCVVSFDPAAGPRRYRRRLDLLATPHALVVTFVVPDRAAEARLLLANLDLPDVVAGADLAVARRALAVAEHTAAESTAAESTRAERTGAERTRAEATDSAARLAVARRAVARLSGHARSAFVIASRLVRGRDADRAGDRLGSPSGDQAPFHGDQRAS